MELSFPNARTCKVCITAEWEEKCTITSVINSIHVDIDEEMSICKVHSVSEEVDVQISIPEIFNISVFAQSSLYLQIKNKAHYNYLIFTQLL